MFKVGDIVVYSGGLPQVNGWYYRDGKPRKVEKVLESGAIVLEGGGFGPIIPEVFTLYSVDLENK